MYKINGWKAKTGNNEQKIIPAAYKYASFFDMSVCPGAKYETSPPKLNGCPTLNLREKKIIFRFFVDF